MSFERLRLDFRVSSGFCSFRDIFLLRFGIFNDETIVNQLQSYNTFVIKQPQAQILVNFGGIKDAFKAQAVTELNDEGNIVQEICCWINVTDYYHLSVFQCP